jgi:hypothetical protein
MINNLRTFFFDSLVPFVIRTSIGDEAASTEAIATNQADGHEISLSREDMEILDDFMSAVTGQDGFG